LKTMDVILTAAVTVNGMIARHPTEVVDWSEDLQLFREQTIGQTVVMGSNTESTLATELDGREVVVMHRDMDPETVISQTKTEKCFIIGGAQTYSRFSLYLTHIFLTYHPHIFPSDSVTLFSNLEKEISLSYIRKVAIDKALGIYQFQYRVMRVD